MPSTKLTALAATLALVTLVGCGGGGGGGGNSEAKVKAKVATEIAKEGLDKKASECFAGVIVDEIGVKKLKDVDFSASAPPKGLESEFTAAALKALKTCKIDTAQLKN
ncbi:MAG: hypothetical protein ABIY48_03935 [Acidimicrobiales bacterium]